MKTNYFTAIKKPIMVIGGKKIEDKVAIVRQDNKTCIGIVGNNFQIVDDNQLLSHVYDITSKLKMKWNIVKRSEIRGGKKTITEIEFSDFKIVHKKNDDLKLRAHIINGYDGSSSAKLMLGFFRVICKNGMVIGKRDMVIGYKHMGKVNEKLVSNFDKYLKTKIAESQKQINELSDISFKSEKEIESIIERVPVIGKKYNELILEALDKEKVAKPLSGWALYNAYTYVIAHQLKINEENRIYQLKRLNTVSLEWRR